jgi:1-acyl-sn-glycerol-3-phosphate acyltransferase
MKSLLGYICTPFFHLHYFLVFVFIHPLQVISYNLIGDNARRKIVDVLNYLLVNGLYIMGIKPKVVGRENIPNYDRPIIIVANHQSLYDIPPVGHIFRKHYAKFIAKAELGKNIPSISYNLRKGQSALIDRNKGAQSVKEIFKVGRHIEANNYAVCIFPEGTRSKTGSVRTFMPAGINTLLRAAPSAVIIPMAIKGHSQLLEKGMYPLKFGQAISYTIMEPIEPKGRDVNELVLELQQMIKEKVES